MKHREIRYLIVCASNTQALENLTVKDLSIRDRKKGYLATKYHYVITRDGVIEEGRSITDAGAYLEDGHSIIKNNNSLGVCLIGGSDSNGESFFNYSSVQIFSLNTLVTQLKTDYPQLITLGLNDVTKTKEPHFSVEEFMKNGK
tara:strand:+ start:765 stop:1196 length:432 start_codon:yes stop_codon:yes gene_type:complete